MSIVFSAEHKRDFSCTTCGAPRFQRCVRLGGYGVGTMPHRYYCHVARHNKALRSMRRQRDPNRL